MIDNFSIIRGMLEFRSEDDFYFIQILQRKKDVKPDNERKVAGANNNSRLIKMYTVHSLDYFNRIEKEVKELCNLFNARAGINLNRRSYEKSSFHLLRKVADQIMNRGYNHALKAYSSVCGAYNNESEKKWILDIDEDQATYDIHYLSQLIYEIQPIGYKIVDIIPSKSGFHLITTPFDLSIFKKLEECRNIEVHKDNPTNLYIP